MTTDLSGFSEWWSTETEYFLQRIERWASFVRGYNRLRSERLSQARMTMHEDHQWTYVSHNFIVSGDIDQPNSQASRKEKDPAEGMKINCCGGTFNYKSNGNLDSNCLETYSYDHSIYFKTIGDIRKSKMIPNKNGNDHNEIHKSTDCNNMKCTIELEDITDEVIEFNDIYSKSWNNENYDDTIINRNCNEITDTRDMEELNNNFQIPNFGVQHLFV